MTQKTKQEGVPFTSQHPAEKNRAEQAASILIVDDQTSNLKPLLHFLRQHSFTIHIAENGERAIEILANLHPDLILLDIMMPGMDGLETCKKIKTNLKTADIPIIFMTALDSLQDKVHGFEAGGADYITKPFAQDEVLIRVNTHITLHRQQRKLQQTLAKKQALSGILRICSGCKKIKNDDGYWQQVEQYLAEHSEALFRHGMCPSCRDKINADLSQQ